MGSAAGIRRKGSVCLPSHWKTDISWYLSRGAIGTTWVRLLRKAGRAVSSQWNVSSEKFISSNWMDEVIQIFVIKIAGQKTRQKDLKEEQHFKNENQTHLVLNFKSFTYKSLINSHVSNFSSKRTEHLWPPWAPSPRYPNLYTDMKTKTKNSFKKLQRP